MPKLILVSLVLLLIGAALWAGYAFEGSHVDADGVLREPFHLLALGWIFMLAGGAMITLGAGVEIIHRIRRRN